MGITITSFRITGISPLLMNNPAAMAGPSEGLARKKIPSPADEAKSKVYADDKGHLFVPTMMFRSALLGACAGRRIGKVGAKTVIAGAIFTVADRAPLVHPTTGKPITDYAISTMRAVVQGSGVQRSRPEVREWACDLDLEVDSEFVPNVSLLVELLNIAGRIRGIGDFRPQKGGPYGRFRADLVDNAIKSRRKAG